MPRDYKTYLEDIRDSIGKILRYTEFFTLEGLADDEKTLDAVIRNLEIIGEAVKNVPNEIRDQYPNIEWKRIAGLRDVLIQKYSSIDLDIVWDIVQNKLPSLQDDIEKILEKIP
jgi:uncharacterized protein with HEPN domain